MIISILGEPLAFSLGVIKANFTAGRVIFPSAVFITHERALPPGPVKISMIRPTGQMPRGVKSSSIPTRSPVLMISSGCDHFVCRMSVGTFFLAVDAKSNPFSFSPISNLADSLLVGWSLKAIEGVYTKGLPRRKWFGVIDRSSAISLFTCINGRPFKNSSVSTTIVMKRSRERRADPRFRRKTRLIILNESLPHTTKVRSRRRVHFPAGILIL